MSYQEYEQQYKNELTPSRIVLYSLYDSTMKLIKSAQWEEQRYYNWAR